MAELPQNKFCIVKLHDIMPDDSVSAFQCVPSSWIKRRFTSSRHLAMVAFPSKISKDHNKLVQRGTPPSSQWPQYRAIVITERDNYLDQNQLMLLKNEYYNATWMARIGNRQGDQFNGAINHGGANHSGKSTEKQPQRADYTRSMKRKSDLNLHNKTGKTSIDAKKPRFDNYDESLPNNTLQEPHIGPVKINGQPSRQTVIERVRNNPEIEIELIRPEASTSVERSSHSRSKSPNCTVTTSDRSRTPIKNQCCYQQTRLVVEFKEACEQIFPLLVNVLKLMEYFARKEKAK